MRRLLDEYEGGRRDTGRTWVHTPLAQAIGLDAGSLAMGRRAGGAGAGSGAVGPPFFPRPVRRGLLAMLVMLAGFGFTFTRVMPRQPSYNRYLRECPRRLVSGGYRGAERAGAAPRGGFSAWLGPFWMAGVAIFHLRSLASWMAARRLRRTGVCLAPDHWRERLDGLRARVRLSRPVTLLDPAWPKCP